MCIRDSSDGLSDWFEMHYLGTLDHDAEDDLDGDSLTLAVEEAHELHPKLVDSIHVTEVIEAVGVSFNFIANTEVELALKSEPAGIIDEASNMEDGAETTITAEDSYGTLRFTVWKLNGVEQRDANGQALNPHTFNIDGNSTATAVLVEQDADTDGDGLTDWYELLHLGNLENQLTDDADGDGLSLIHI